MGLIFVQGGQDTDYLGEDVLGLVCI